MNLLTREQAEALRAAELEHRAERRGIDRRTEKLPYVGVERRKAQRREQREAA